MRATKQAFCWPSSGRAIVHSLYENVAGECGLLYSRTYCTPRLVGGGDFSGKSHTGSTVCDDCDWVCGRKSQIRSAVCDGCDC